LTDEAVEALVLLGVTSPFGAGPPGPANWSTPTPSELVSFQGYNPGSNVLYSLVSNGDFVTKETGAVKDGRGLTIMGPVFKPTGDRQFPYVTINHARNHKPRCEDCLLVLHPDIDDGAVVSVRARVTGTYDVSAVFARVNDINAGNGVRVVICINGNFRTTLFDEVITSAYKVDPSDPFSGGGKRHFHKAIDLRRYDLLQFAVFPAKDPNDPNKKDRGFDHTAFKATISAKDTSPIVLPLDCPGVWH
jgi:hypothetical protein